MFLVLAKFLLQPFKIINIHQSDWIFFKKKWLSNVLSFAQAKIYVSHEINKSWWLKNIMNKITKEIKQVCHEMQTCPQFKYCCSNISWQCTLTYFLLWENEAAANKTSSNFKQSSYFSFPEFKGRSTKSYHVTELIQALLPETEC